MRPLVLLFLMFFFLSIHSIFQLSTDNNIRGLPCKEANFANNYLQKDTTTNPSFTTKPIKGHFKFNLDRFIIKGQMIEKYSQNDEITP